MRVLIAEDDEALRSVLVRGLRRHGYTVDEADRGDDALHRLRVEDYAVAILDWRMPGLAGVEVVQQARREGVRTPILMLTARDTASDRIEGLDAGADDYVLKPFDFGELLARIRALMRRPTAVAEPVLRLGGLSLDPAGREVVAGGRVLPLTPYEYAILELLMRRVPAVVSRDSLAHHVWDHEDVTWNTIEVHMARLRAKLVGAHVEITAVRGTGYRLTER